MSTTVNVPFGPGYDEQSATSYATELARRCDELNAAADYVVSTYSPYSSDEIAAIWAGSDSPTAEQLAKANEFKAWTNTVKTMIDDAMAGDVGYQITKWRNASPYPGLR
jgi:hypothetical protein